MDDEQDDGFRWFRLQAWAIGVRMVHGLRLRSQDASGLKLEVLGLIDC